MLYNIIDLKDLQVWGLSDKYFDVLCDTIDAMKCERYCKKQSDDLSKDSLKELQEKASVVESLLIRLRFYVMKAKETNTSPPDDIFDCIQNLKDLGCFPTIYDYSDSEFKVWWFKSILNTPNPADLIRDTEKDIELGLRYVDNLRNLISHSNDDKMISIGQLKEILSWE